MEELISKSEALEALHNIGGCGAQKNSWDDGWDSAIDAAYDVVGNITAVVGVKVPCKIGDRVWAIRSYKGIKKAQEGIVSEMFFTPDMHIMIVVKNVARGFWGKTVFGTLKEAENATERKDT